MVSNRNSIIEQHNFYCTSTGTKLLTRYCFGHYTILLIISWHNWHFYQIEASTWGIKQNTVLQLDLFTVTDTEKGNKSTA
jgi:hypothetical protein